MQWHELIYMDAPKGQERVLDLLGFKSQGVLCMLGTESGLKEEQQMLLLAEHQPYILQPYISVLMSISIVLWIPAQVL